MFLGKFKKYSSEYVKGVKYVYYRTFRPKIVKGETTFTEKEISFGNYDLQFNRQGLLLQSTHVEKRSPFQIIYAYDRKGRLVSAMKVSYLKNELLSISEFTYDGQGRIELEQCRTFFHIFGHVALTKRIHTYKGNTEEILLTSDDEEEDEHTFYLTYDDKHRVIEDKSVRNEDELVVWYKSQYNDNGDIVKCVFLNENGEEENRDDHFPFVNGMDTGYKNTSKKDSYIREHRYEFDENNRWINQVSLLNGVPQYIYEKKFEYYIEE